MIKLRFLIIIVIVCILLPVTIYFISFHSGLSADHTRWSEFGSFIGGSVGSLLSFLTIIIILWNSHLQRAQFNIERENLSLQILNIKKTENIKTLILLSAQIDRTLDESIGNYESIKLFLRQNLDYIIKYSRSYFDLTDAQLEERYMYFCQIVDGNKHNYGNTVIYKVTYELDLFSSKISSLLFIIESYLLILNNNVWDENEKDIYLNMLKFKFNESDLIFLAMVDKFFERKSIPFNSWIDSLNIIGSFQEKTHYPFDLIIELILKIKLYTFLNSFHKII